MNKVRRDSPRQLDHLHRTGAVVFGLGIGAFGVLGFVNRLDMFSTTGRPVLGLSSNGLLSTISVVVAAILIAAGLRGGRTASTVLVVVGAAFVASGLVNTLVLGTPLNLLAFRIPNVVFSFIAALLLFLGAWGWFTGRLPTTTLPPRTAPGRRGAWTCFHLPRPHDVAAARAPRPTRRRQHTASRGRGADRRAARRPPARGGCAVAGEPRLTAPDGSAPARRERNPM
jgi:hypothetical protein